MACTAVSSLTASAVRPQQLAAASRRTPSARVPLPSRQSAFTGAAQHTLRPCSLSLGRHSQIVQPLKAGEEEREFVKNTEFGYSRKDVILIGMGFFALGYGMYYGLQATGMEPGIAGNWVQLIVILGMMLGWVSTYLFRVANKEMTYVKQLDDYETAVMAKRMEEMPESELEKMLEELESEKAGKEPK